MANASAVISGRNYLVYSTPWAANILLPVNETVEYGAAWGTPATMTAAWTDRGYTSGGLTFNMNLTRGEIRVDQEFDPIYRPITGRTVTMSCNLAEMSPANLKLASGMGTVTANVADSTHRAYTDLAITGVLSDDYNAWGFDIKQPDNFAFRFLVYKGIATGSPQPRFTPDAAAEIALEITALVDTTTSPSRVALARDITAEHS
jgi:hypothetical protein